VSGRFYFASVFAEALAECSMLRACADRSLDAISLSAGFVCVTGGQRARVIWRRSWQSW
jgi:hypothetical protein